MQNRDLPIQVEQPLPPAETRPDIGIISEDSDGTGTERIEDRTPGIVQECLPGHLPDLRHFIAQANDGFRRILSKPRGYDNVLACFTTWQDHENPEIIASAEALRDLLREEYHYRVEEIQLPSTAGATRHFNKLISDYIDTISSACDVTGNPGNNLFILYYGGHAGIRKQDSKGVWFNREIPRYSFVEWGSVEYSVSLASCDVLFIFDCCFSGGILKRETAWPRRCELLGASGPRERAGNGRDNFTAAVERELRKSVANPKSVVQLYWHLSGLPNCRHLVASPRWDRYTSKEEFKSSIRLHPLSASEGASSSTAGTRTPSPARTLTATEADNVLQDAELATKTHVLLAIRFSNRNEAPVLDEYLDWVQNRPQNIDQIRIIEGNDLRAAVERVVPARIKFRSIFESNSALAIVSMPLWMWTCVWPEIRLSCTFIDFIRSDKNLLEPGLSPGAPVADTTASTRPVLPNDKMSLKAKGVVPPPLSKDETVYSHPGQPRPSISPLRPRPSATRRDDWIKALHKQDNTLLAELVESQPPGEALFELETYINCLYRAYDIQARLMRGWVFGPAQTGNEDSQNINANHANNEEASSHGHKNEGKTIEEQSLERLRQETKAKAERVVPFIESIRRSLGWDVREFDLQLLKLMRKSSALSLVLGAGVSCAEPCGAPAWPALVRELLQVTLECGLEIPVRVSEETEETPLHASGEPGVSSLHPEASGATGMDPSINPDVRAETSRTTFVRFKQRRVKEYTDTERQQAQKIISKIDAWEADDELLKDGAELAHSLCGQHLFTYMTEILYRNHRQPSAIHRAIARLAHAQYVPDRPSPGYYPGWDALITYNFDAFMSSALTDEGVPSAAWAMRGRELAGDPNNFALQQGQRCQWIQDVLHLHGYTPPRFFRITNVRFVFATSQYAATYDQEESAIFRKVLNEYLENPIHVALYVGCSFADNYMNRLLERAIQRSPGRYHYALLKWPRNRCNAVPTAEELRTEERKYLAMGVRPIWFDEFAEIPHLIARLE
jgi:hypothetical protein